jgi:hypothetical protein
MTVVDAAKLLQNTQVQTRQRSNLMHARQQVMLNKTSLAGIAFDAINSQGV